MCSSSFGNQSPNCSQEFKLFYVTTYDEETPTEEEDFGNDFFTRNNISVPNDESQTPSDKQTITSLLPSPSKPSELWKITKTLTSSDDYPFKCSICDYVSAVKSSLESHTIYKHTRKFPETCKLCNKGLINKTQLRAHIKKFHKKYLKELILEMS